MANIKTKDNWDDLSEDEDEKTNALATIIVGNGINAPVSSIAAHKTAVIAAHIPKPIPNKNASLFKVKKKKKVNEKNKQASDDSDENECDAYYGDELNQMDKQMGNYVSLR